MNIVFGPDNNAAVGLPRDVTHIRLTSMNARVRTNWPGSNDPVRTWDLNSNQRADVAVPTGHRGIAVVGRLSGNAPVYLTWVVAGR